MGLTKLRLEFDKLVGYNNRDGYNDTLWAWVKNNAKKINDIVELQQLKIKETIMKAEQPNRPFTDEEKKVGINKRVEQPQQKYIVYVDEFLVDDAPYPDHKRRSTHECYVPVGARLLDVAENIDEQINKTYLDEDPPEVIEIQIIGIFAVDGSNPVVDVEVMQEIPYEIKGIEVNNDFYQEFIKRHVRTNEGIPMDGVRMYYKDGYMRTFKIR